MTLAEEKKKAKEDDMKYFFGYFKWYWGKHGFFKAFYEFFGKRLVKKIFYQIIYMSGFAVGSFFFGKYVITPLGYGQYLTR